MTANEIAANDIDRISRKYRQMPYGGAMLGVTPEGCISNGVCIVTRFTSDRAAKIALNAAGFVKFAGGWKLVK